MALFDFLSKNKKGDQGTPSTKKFVSLFKKLSTELDRKLGLDERDENEIAGLHKQIAEVLIKLGRPSEAVMHYASLADHYSERGFFNKAVATYKKALNLDPSNTDLLDKIVNYNRKVPKFMVDTRLADEMREKSNRLKNESQNEDSGT